MNSGGPNNEWETAVAVLVLFSVLHKPEQHGFLKNSCSSFCVFHIIGWVHALILQELSQNCILAQIPTLTIGKQKRFWRM